MSELNVDLGGDSAAVVGLVDGSTPASTRRFQVVLADDAVAQLDELVASTQTLPDGRSLTHYGIVVEGTGQIEGADFPSDTGRITRDHTMPGITTAGLKWKSSVRSRNYGWHRHLVRRL